MPRNIIIYSDGTGQGGGVSIDERRTNIYKLYRATRVGHDSPIDPAEQVAYYDAGLGSRPPGGGSVRTLVRTVHNFISQATGLGLTANIIDCYEMIIRHWRPGDRIFLFGFSRGAYTVRCLGGVLAYCGVPVCLADGSPMKYDNGTVRRIATEAVKSVYQHTASRDYDTASDRQKELLDQRKELASRFRAKYGVDHERDKSHYPYFIGVFDTVASIASKGALLVLGIAVVALLALLYWALSGFSVYWFVGAVVLLVGGAAVWALTQSLKFAPSADRNRWWRTLTFSIGRLRFNDMTLSDNVRYARHAIAVDEERASFDWVPWEGKRAEKVETDENGVVLVEQRWFPGNHSDIGGGYPECESRLSDIALAWMVGAARSVEGGMRVDESALHHFPAADGIQHDELRVGFPILTPLFGFSWKRQVRTLPCRPGRSAALHPTVLARARLNAVLQYDAMKQYRPDALIGHEDLRGLYPAAADCRSTGSESFARRLLSRFRRPRPMFAPGTDHATARWVA